MDLGSFLSCGMPQMDAEMLVLVLETGVYELEHDVLGHPCVEFSVLLLVR